MKANEKKCPRCAEAVKWDAQVCKHCRHEFTAEEMKAGGSRVRSNRRVAGCAVIFVAGGIVALAASLGSDAAERRAAEETAAPERARLEQQRFRAQRELGLHCTQGEKQYLADLGQAVAERLRDPSSFQHINTSIAPANDKGIHQVSMRYRAANGYGGLDTDEATAELTNENCTVRLVSAGKG